jgi:hypothetical protein
VVVATVVEFTEVDIGVVIEEQRTGAIEATEV